MRSVVESVGIESDEETFYLIGGEYCNPPSLTRALNVPEREIKHPVIALEPLTPS